MLSTKGAVCLLCLGVTTSLPVLLGLKLAYFSTGAPIKSCHKLKTAVSLGSVHFMLLFFLASLLHQEVDIPQINTVKAYLK